ncbi:unnamed protein product [Arctia plantaginis]|uniref:HAT C-terminal dimerisation domain-containing protein n=1 Tax=Arctia plantaginis TaxID=874455 RepID=A0A8S0ZED6_ARCPL|nr:unnamed protein product [Arctia plantaginis]
MQDWQITNKITCVVSDNAANIQAAIRLGEWRPVGCFAHTLNLIVQNGLKVISEIVGKVKSIVEYFKKSCTAQTKLESVLKQMGLPILKLKQECPTRWNSCYEMLERILRVKDAVISTLALIRNELNLQIADWEVLETVVAILKPFFEVTVEVSSENHVTLSKVLVFTQIMSKHIIKNLAKTYKHPVIPELLNKLKTQIEARLFDLESNILYADSTILDPRFKQKGFRTQKSYENAIEDIRRRISRIQINSTVVYENQVCLNTNSAPVDTDSMWADFDTDMNQGVRPENSVAAGIRELDKYMKEEYLHRKEDPLKWWHSRKHIYPHIYQLVLKRLCIQATSVSCERIFSGAGQVITNRRKLLKPSKVSQVVFLHSNM